MGRPKVIREEKESTGKRGRKPKSASDYNARQIIADIKQMNWTSLSKENLEEAVYIFCKYLSYMFESQHIPEETVVHLPYLGKFKQTKKLGLKKGETRKRPSAFKKGAEPLIEVMEEDEGDFLQLVFRVSPTLSEKVKNESRKNDLKRRKNEQ